MQVMASMLFLKSSKQMKLITLPNKTSYENLSVSLYIYIGKNEKHKKAECETVVVLQQFTCK